MATKLDHTDSSKTTYLCPSCDTPYFQVDKDEWEANRNKWDRKARRYYFKSHKCWWKTKHIKTNALRVPFEQLADTRKMAQIKHNKMLDSAEHEYLVLKREKEEEVMRETKQAMEENSE